jgi:hypothetical protein
MDVTLNPLPLDPDVWGPHFWFVLHTMALTYPATPNETTKKKYYDFLSNLPLFLPIANMGNVFSQLLDKYPVQPYLDSRESFVRWVNFIHNKINEQLQKPQLSLEDSLKAYYAHYVPKAVTSAEQRRMREKMVFGGILFLAALCGLVLYRR